MNRGVDLPDLVQDGSLGLMRAIEKFEYRRGFVLDLCDLADPPGDRARGRGSRPHDPRAPRVGDQYQRVQRHALRFGSARAAGRRRPTSRRKPASTRTSCARCSRCLPSRVSLDAPLPDADTGLVELIDQASASPFEQLADTRMRECVRSLLRSVSPAEADVLRRRFSSAAPSLTPTTRSRRTRACRANACGRSRSGHSPRCARPPRPKNAQSFLDA